MYPPRSRYPTSDSGSRSGKRSLFSTRRGREYRAGKPALCPWSREHVAHKEITVHTVTTYFTLRRCMPYLTPAQCWALACG